MADFRWHANVYRAERGQVGLVRPGNGRPDSDPWADRGTIHIIGPTEARTLAAELVAAADAAEAARQGTPMTYLVHDRAADTTEAHEADTPAQAAELAADGYHPGDGPFRFDVYDAADTLVGRFEVVGVATWTARGVSGG